MSLEEQVEQIMDDAYNNVMNEGLQVEAEDFKNMEAFFEEQVDGVVWGTSELWYLSTAKGREDAIVLGEMNEKLNDGEELKEVLSILHKNTYENINHLMRDEKAFAECKLNDSVGMIVRTVKEEGKITTLMTPRGAHFIVRYDNGRIRQEMIKKNDIHKSGLNFLVSLFNACFTW